MNTLSYETSVKLAKFLGRNVPKPIDEKWWCYISYPEKGIKQTDVSDWRDGMLWGRKIIPAYTLEDILSQPFCAAMAKKHPHARYFDGKCEDLPWEINLYLNEAYYNNGFLSVEKELLKIIKKD